YLLLKKYGGVFVDLDLECLKPIEPLLGEWPVFVGREPDSHSSHPAAIRQQMSKIVGTAFLASIPEHPFWDHLIKLLPFFREEADPIAATGSIFLTAAIASFPGKDAIGVAAPALLN